MFLKRPCAAAVLVMCDNLGASAIHKTRAAREKVLAIATVIPAQRSRTPDARREDLIQKTEKAGWVRSRHDADHFEDEVVEDQGYEEAGEVDPIPPRQQLVEARHDAHPAFVCRLKCGRV